ncbi:MAG: translocation/assembly module TamB domain-containing protein [Gemmatimonadota bacterium]
MRVSRWVRGIAFSIGVVVILVMTTTLLLARTAPGRSLVLSQALERARALVNGSLEVGAFGGGDLFEQASLIDVVLRDPDGMPLLTADSILVGYSAWSLLTGSRELSSLDVHGALLVLRSQEGGWNVARVFADTAAVPAAQPAVADSTDTGLVGPARFVLRNVELHRTSIRIEPPDGRPLQFSAIDAELPRVVLGGAQGIDVAEIYRLGFQAALLEGTVDVQEMVGRVEHEANQLRVEVARLRLPESEAKGGVQVSWSDSTGVVTALQIDARPVALEELRWLLPELPQGRVQGHLEGALAPGSSRWSFSEARYEGRGGALTASGDLTFDPDLRFERMALSVENLDLALLEPWLPDTTLAWGRVDGTARVDGPPSRLALDANLTLRDPAGALTPSRLVLDGVVRTGRTVGASDLRVVGQPFDYALLHRWGGPGWLSGPGEFDVRVDGTLAEGLQLQGWVQKGSTAAPPTRIAADVRLQRPAGEALGVLGTLDLEPLRLVDLMALAPELEPRGEARGRVEVSGTVEALQLTTDLETSGGPLDVRARVTRVGGRAAVEVQGTLAALDLSALSGSVPERTAVNGSVDLTLGPAEGALTAALDLTSSRLAGIQIRQVSSALRVDEGVLRLDSLAAASALGRLDARGTLALEPEAPEGALQIALTEGTLAGLRPLVFGEEGDLPVGLAEVRRRLEALEGSPADTSAVDLGGAFELRGTLRGTARALIGEGRVEFTDAVYKGIRAERAVAQVDRFDLQSGDLEARVEGTAVALLDRPFQSATGTVGLSGGRGRVVMELVRESGTVFAAGEIDADSTATLLHVDQFSLVDQGERWNLGGPARLAWGPQGLEVRDLTLLRSGVETFRLDANGTLPRDGSGSLAVEVRALDLARISRVIAFQENDIEGLVDLSLDVTGTLGAPVIEGKLGVRDLRYRVVRFDLLEGDLDYRGRVLRGSVFGWRGGRRAVRIEGTMPADLALVGVQDRIPEGPVRLSMQADSVPLANVLGFFPNYEQVEGELSGNFVVAGTPSDLQPSGAVRLTGGAATLPDFGIRPSEADGTFELTPNGVVTVDATLREGGRARVTGTLNLNPIADPGFDLDIVTVDRDVVRAAARREMEARVAGSVHLGGSYRRPELTGQLNVREGVLYLDEFVRAATIVDLTDPALAEFDRELLALEPIVRESQNPFIQNLRVTVDVSMDGNVWLRSPEMNVEMAGALLLTFDRSNRTLAMLGDLNALRGTYRVVGRQFDVQQGTVRFLGTPGVNPTLEITALNRLRTAGSGGLDITASVDGTMLRPEVHLTSDLPGATQEDLISYLLFGQPQAALSQLARQGGSVLGSAGLTLTLGALASQVGSLVAEELPFDYLAVTTQQAFSQGVSQNAVVAGLRTAEVEVGKYVADDVFLALILSPFASQRFSGFRVEWRLSDEVGVEGFVERRLAQLGATGFDELLFDLRRVIGVRLFREWGY